MSIRLFNTDAYMTQKVEELIEYFTTSDILVLYDIMVIFLRCLYDSKFDLSKPNFSLFIISISKTES